MDVSSLATPRQKLAISKLCRVLGVREQVELKVLTLGEAGRIIREMSKTIKVRRVK